MPATPADLQREPEKVLRPLPQRRKEEAFLTLHQRMNELLSKDWGQISEEKVKRQINDAMAHSLRIWI